MSVMAVPVQPFLLAQWAPFQALAGAFAEGDPCLRVDGLWGSSRSLVAAALRDSLQTDRSCRATAEGCRHLTRVRLLKKRLKETTMTNTPARQGAADMLGALFLA